MVQKQKLRQFFRFAVFFTDFESKWSVFKIKKKNEVYTFRINYEFRSTYNADSQQERSLAENIILAIRSLQPKYKQPNKNKIQITLSNRH